LEATRRENSYLLDVLRKLPDFLESGGNKNNGKLNSYDIF
jgi:hypothetical protein